MPATAIPLREDIASAVEDVDAGYVTQCHQWTRNLSSEGYARCYAGEGMSPLYVHRLVYERAHGAIPQGMHIDHLCRNRACCRLEHLELVTHAENLRRGEGARLTAEDVEAIRSSALSNRALAQKFGVHHAHISKVRRGVKWADTLSR